MNTMIGCVIRSGLVLGAFWGAAFWAEESQAQLFRGRNNRGPSHMSQPSNPGWRGAQPRSNDLEATPHVSLTDEATLPAEPGLGAILRPAEGGVPFPKGTGQETVGRAGTPVPEHYYKSDWRRDPAARGGTPNYPKYFGGFHSSHYYDLGIPNGDKGFRGNGVYWTPW
jgi:hypothetical protein